MTRQAATTAKLALRSKLAFHHARCCFSPMTLKTSTIAHAHRPMGAAGCLSARKWLPLLAKRTPLQQRASSNIHADALVVVDVDETVDHR